MKIMTATSILLALAASPVFADCTPPNDALAIPNGAAATRDEMMAAQAAVKALNAAMDSYGDCLTKERDAKIAAGGDKAKLTAEYAKPYNVELAKLQQIAAKFNDELHAYMAKHPH